MQGHPLPTAFSKGVITFNFFSVLSYFFYFYSGGCSQGWCRCQVYVGAREVGTLLRSCQRRLQLWPPFYSVNCAFLWSSRFLFHLNRRGIYWGHCRLVRQKDVGGHVFPCMHSSKKERGGGYLLSIFHILSFSPFTFHDGGYYVSMLTIYNPMLVCLVQYS